MTSWDFDRIRESIKDLTRIIVSDPSNAELYLRRGIAFCKLHEWDKAMADFDRVVELEPKNSHVYSNRGYAFLHKEEWDSAIREFSVSLKIVKKADTYVKRATAFGRSDNKQMAMNDLMMAMRMDSSDPNVFRANGLYHQWEGNYEAAVRNYDRCIDESIEEIQAHWYKAECLAELGLNDEAIRSYLDYIQRENPLVVKWIELAQSKIEELERE